MPPLEMDPAIRGIADRIKEVRVRLGWNQEQFAHAIGVPRSHLSDIETYRIVPSLPAILGVLGLHIAAEPSQWEEEDAPTSPARPRHPQRPDRPISGDCCCSAPVLPATIRPARRTRSG